MAQLANVSDTKSVGCVIKPNPESGFLTIKI